MIMSANWPSASPAGHPVAPRCAFSRRTYHKDSAGAFVYQPPHREASASDGQRQAVELGVEIGEYHGVVRVPRRGPNGSCQGGPHRRSALKPIISRVPVREHRRAEDPPTPFERRRNVEISGRHLR